MIHCVEHTEIDCVTDVTDVTVTFYINMKIYIYIILVTINKS